MKKLIAYSSVAHMGFVTLGIFVFTMRGVEGAIMQMINHGVTTGALFMLVGAIYERSHSREIADNMGLGKYLPAYMFFFGLFAIASFGFPGTNGFVSEALVLIGVFEANYLLGALTIPGVMLAAAYMLRLGLKLAWGQPSQAQQWKDLNTREWVYLLPLGHSRLLSGSDARPGPAHHQPLGHAFARSVSNPQAPAPGNVPATRAAGAGRRQSVASEALSTRGDQ
jgi:NADH-quinone oxidoreductase subunit M